MGGLGSGIWYRYSTRFLVEESLVLAVDNFRRDQRWPSSGTITWTFESGHQCYAQFTVALSPGAPTITLLYRWEDQEDVRIPIRLQTTRFGRQRWWFTCPLVIDGKPCNGRSGKLYLPPGGKYFGCRKCHQLTYRSCQEAHQKERLLAIAKRLKTDHAALQK
jgi:hypothetical protein